jgi:ATP-dependent DNA helicase RecG
MDLSSKITDLPKVGPIFARKFEKLGIKTLEDFFYHVPNHYLDYSLVTTINRLHPDETATIHAKIVSITNIFSKRGIRMQIGSVEDATGKITVVWFNQPFLIRTLYPGRAVSLSGKVGWFNRKLCFSSPDYEILGEIEKPTVHTGRLVPVYPETSGLSSKWLRTLMLGAFNYPALKIDEFLPEEVLKRTVLLSIRDAIENVHFPNNLKEAEKGRERLAFNELLMLELTSLHRKINWKKNAVANKLTINQSEVDKFIDTLPFKLTASQVTAVKEILADLTKDYPMNRLLEGDVGSGKTVVAATAAFATFLNGCQTVIMAPTQILATQHYETFKKLLTRYNIRISLMTSDDKKSELGRNDIFIGTHALIHSKVNFDKVGLVVIDEQHRFGVEQRKHLVKKTGTPHTLTMTATPIPRTIALTSYGDLDLSVLTDMPKGRQKITTWFVPETKRNGAYDWIRSQITIHSSQCFIVCPLIEDSTFETMADIKSVTSEFLKLKSIFKNQKLGLLHGRLKPNEKTKVLNDFRNRKTDILVTTPVVEVGLDIPNATVMVIEAAERFGLAQLHQLRGRVGRGKEKSYCLLFSNIKYSKRLKAMEKMHSGVELAELDLKIRGPGEIFGTAQSGFPELKVASWNNFPLLKKAKDVASDIIKNPGKYPKTGRLINLETGIA